MQLTKNKFIVLFMMIFRTLSFSAGNAVLQVEPTAAMRC